MGILTVIIVTCLNFVCVGIDILTFFLIVRIALTKWTIEWLVPFDSAGSKLVDWFSEYVKRWWQRATAKTLTLQARLAIGLMGLLVLRFLVVGIVRMF